MQNYQTVNRSAYLLACTCGDFPILCRPHDRAGISAIAKGLPIAKDQVCHFFYFSKIILMLMF